MHENDDHEGDAQPSPEDETSKVKSVGGRFDDFQPSPLPIGADGGVTPVAVVGTPAPLPPASPASFVCLRGPCRHYWEFQSPFDSGNTREFWESTGGPPAVQISRTCLRSVGTETELVDTTINHCNMWDPLEQVDLVQIDTRRRRYLDANPDIAEIFEQEAKDRAARTARATPPERPHGD